MSKLSFKDGFKYAMGQFLSAMMISAALAMFVVLALAAIVSLR